MTFRLPTPVKMRPVGKTPVNKTIVNKTAVKKTLMSLAMVAACASCTPDAYRRDADLQVGKLLSDRKQQTLGYTPKTVVSGEAVAAPTKKSYASIPTTPIAPPQPS